VGATWRVDAGTLTLLVRRQPYRQNAFTQNLRFQTHRTPMPSKRFSGSILAFASSKVVSCRYAELRRMRL